jgi:hypothetical protein
VVSLFKISNPACCADVLLRIMTDIFEKTKEEKRKQDKTLMICSVIYVLRLEQGSTVVDSLVQKQIVPGLSR